VICLRFSRRWLGIAIVAAFAAGRSLASDAPERVSVEAPKVLTLGLTEASEVTRNLHGGLRTGQAYRGLTTLTLSLDTEAAGGWQGGTVFASALQIHGREFTPQYVGSFHTASNLEARRATRLWELWYRHQLGDAMDIKLGQQSIDQEFMINSGASPFAAAYFGWPALPSVNLPASGGVYPLASLGMRARAQLSDRATLLAGVFAGDAANSGTEDAQIANRRGTTFSLHGGTLAIAEVQSTVNRGGAGAASPALPGTYKLGAWHHSKQFPDQRLDSSGLSQADPASDGSVRQHRGNYSLYAVADQMVWRAAGEGGRALNVFARAMAAPADRNLVSFSANLGATMTAPFATRPRDVVGLGVAFLELSRDARALERDANAFSGTRTPARSHETLLEATYQCQLAAWWMVQGILQYTVRPGAGAVDPSDPARTTRVPNATVIGLRTTLTF
jgi:porin